MVCGMKRFLFAGCLLLSAAVQAVTLKDIFLQMPSDVLPTLNLAARRDLVDFYENNRTATAPSVFDYKATLSVFTEDYLLLQTSSVSTLQVKLLPVSDNTVILLINTAMGPLPDSRVRFYTKNWKPIQGISMPELLPRLFLDTTRLNADQMSRFDQICRHFFVRMDADPMAPAMHVRASFSEDVPQELLAPFKGFYTDSLTLTWNGKGFQR